MAPRTRFEDVITDAVANAVRRAVDDVSRTVPPQLAAAPPGPLPRRRDRPRPPADDLDPYAMVGVDVGAPWEELVASYHLRAKAWHPDAPDTPDRSGDLLRRLNRAYEELRVRRGKRPLDGVLQPTPVAKKREPQGDEGVDLGAPEHAWWAASPIDPYQRDGAPASDAAPPETEPEPEAPSSELVPDDPYEVLRVRPSASWEEIVTSLNAAYAELRVRRGR
jgi:hypothetical protein